MDVQLGRRALFTATSAVALGTTLSACGSEKKHDKPAKSTAPMSPPASTGTPPSTIMIIRHAEKPDGSGKPYGITEDGDRDDESLTVRGWTRAGALVDLFNPRNPDGSPATLRPGLSRPATIFASNPDKHGSKRPEETVTPLAAALGLKIDNRFPKGQEADLVTALNSTPGPVLISWQHENIDAILTHLGQLTPTHPNHGPATATTSSTPSPETPTAGPLPNCLNSYCPATPSTRSPDLPLRYRGEAGPACRSGARTRCVANALPGSAV